MSRAELVIWLKNILLPPGYLIVSAKLDECNKNFRKANTGRYGETWSDKIAKVFIGGIYIYDNELMSKLCSRKIEVIQAGRPCLSICWSAASLLDYYSSSPLLHQDKI